MVFSGYKYYPSGGARDLDKSFDDKFEAIQFAETLRGIQDWIHVLDSLENLYVYEY